MSASNESSSSLTSKTVSLQAGFYYFLSDDSKKGAATTAAHSKHIMVLLQNRKVFMTSKSTIWYKTYGCPEQYRCATVLYLLSVLSHAYNIVIDHRVEAPGHGKYIVDGLSDTKKSFLTMLMKTVQLPGASTNESQMVMHTTMSNTDIRLERLFQKHILNPTRSHALFHHGKDRK